MIGLFYIDQCLELCENDVYDRSLVLKLTAIIHQAKQTRELTPGAFSECQAWVFDEEQPDWHQL